jgi:predicted kinase
VRLGASGYTPDVSQRVYACLAENADALLRAGHSVIVDAVFGRAADRSAIERVASAAVVPFLGIWLDAAESVLIARVT